MGDATRVDKIGGEGSALPDVGSGDGEEAARREEAAHRARVDAVLAADNPEESLRLQLQALSEANEEGAACRLFESLFWRLRITNYWVFFQMARCYQMVERQDAAFLMAGLAQAMEPTWSGAPALNRTLFDGFVRQFRPREMVDVFDAHAALFPQTPVAQAYEILPALNAIGRSAASLLGEAGRRTEATGGVDRIVAPESVRPALQVLQIGQGKIPCLASFGGARSRTPVFVACLTDADLLMAHHAIAVRDREGRLHSDLSIATYPPLLVHHVETLGIAPRWVEEAVLIGDRFAAAPNLSHVLLDQITRLACYEAAGVALDAVTVIGPEPIAAFQSEILAGCGVKSFIGTNGAGWLKVGRLWVASNCQAMEHPAHLGAPWALDFLRRTLMPAPAGPPLRLYISRADANSRRVINEEALRACLEAHGFTTILPGRMSHAEQAAAFAAATHVVGPHGAGFANLAFCQAGTEVLEIFHPVYGTEAYAVIASTLGLRYAAMAARDGTSDSPLFNDPDHDPSRRHACGMRDLRVDVERVGEWLESVGVSG